MRDRTGLLLVNKEKGMTSHDVVTRIREIFHLSRVGHTGTLDPKATGLLLILLGKATKLTPFLQRLDKTYRGKMVFGVSTDSLDEEGSLLENKDASNLTKEEIEEILQKFVGKISQIPPMFSAVHFKGRRLYELARQGIEVERPPREVEIFWLNLLNFESGQHPEAEFELRCSGGTYVRSLCSEIGELSGYGAYQSALTRLRIGPFSLESASTLSEIKNEVNEREVEKFILSSAEALPHLPLLRVRQEAEKLIKWGQPLYLAHLKEIPVNLEKGDKVRLCSLDGRLLAVSVSLQNSSHFDKNKAGLKYLRVLV